MGNNQTTASWSTDDWAYGTGVNAVPVEEVVDEVGKLPAKLFGGKAIDNDASMHQMQHDLLSFDETLKRLFFRRRKNKKAAKQAPQEEEQEYYYEDGQAAPEEVIDEDTENSTYLAPTPADREAPTSATNKNKLLWHCSNCASDNKVTESSCRRCGQAETKL